MHVRMDKSRSLLRLTNMSVSAVAKEVGYEDQLAFSKIFKKKFGVSPAQYRKKILEENRKPLSEMYLLGYYLQMNAFYGKQNGNKNEITEGQEE